MRSRRLYRDTIKLLLLLVISVSLLSCETVNYYTQAARGQLAIVFGRDNIHQLLNQETLAQPLREKLLTILAIREFAENSLQLPLGDNYSSYVDVGREHVIWNVFAAPEFSISPISWCFPIAGCVAYRGYFSETAAENYAEKLAEDGYDVYTGPVDAYSTLGWFDDSVLSTIINRPDHQLAALIFHELAHQVVYVPGDTTFNESFATTVEREGLRRWLAAAGQSELFFRASAESQRQAEFVDLVQRFQAKFDELYQNEMSIADKRRAKTGLQDNMREEYESLKSGWDGYAGYDTWFSQPLNNAQLSTVASYNDSVPAFERLLLEVDNDLNRFYKMVGDLAQLPLDERAIAMDGRSAESF